MPQELLDRLARLAELTDEELVELRADLRAYYTATRTGEDARSQVDHLREVVEQIGTADAESTRRETEAATADEALAALDAQLAPIEPEPDPEPDPAPAAEVVEPEPELVPVAAAAEPAPVVPVAPARPATVAAAAAHVPAAVAARPRAARDRNRIVGLAGGLEGAEVTGGMRQVAELTLAKLGTFHGAPGNGEKHAVARILADYDDDRFLGRDAVENDRRIKAAGAGTPDALVAAGGICAPAEPYYGMAQIADDMRPVRAALAAFRADRGGITFIPPNDIGDYDESTDEWTEADDIAVTSTDTTWKPEQEITCADATTVTLRAVTKILKFGNWNGRTHPESVEADLLNATANHSRLAEQLLLDDIKTNSTRVNAANVVSVARDTLFRVGQAASGMRQRQRMDPRATLTWLAPFWLLEAMQADIAMQAPGDDAFAKAHAEIEGYIRARNIDANWYLDSPSTGSTQNFGAQTGGVAGSTLNAFPSYAQWGLWHEGAHLFLDGGTLDLGIVRSPDYNRQNSYQVFAETFEKAAFVGVESLWVTQLVEVSGATACCDESIGS